MNLLTTPIVYGLAGLALAGAMFGGVQTYRLAKAKAQHAQTMAAIARMASIAASKARETEQRHGAVMDAVAQQHQRDIQHAQDTYVRTVADLRSGALQLSNRWSCPATGLPRTPARPSQPDGGADDRAESAGRVVLAAAQCDAQVRGLQAVVIGDRMVGPKQ